MGILNQQQLEQAKKIMDVYLLAPAGENGLTPPEAMHELDKNRRKIGDQVIDPLLSDYFDGRKSLSEFKSKVDSINKRNALWGFGGIKGQMFFNMLVNVADDMDECDQELKASIAVPANNQIASSRIKTFKSYVKRMGDQWVEAGNTRHGSPKVGSIPFFLSYFWQIKDRETWPIYFPKSVNTLSDLNIWQTTGDMAEDYLLFKNIHEELAAFFFEVSGKPFDLYGVEHVLWYRTKTDKGTGTEESNEGKGKGLGLKSSDSNRLPESYVPPIVAILPRIANHDEALVKAAKNSAITLDRAFEKNINAAFTILGYETQLMGQGGGRVPDGIARAIDDNYAILWDAKVRSNTYSMGTDDRTIREYITTQNREFKRRRSLRNLYYLIISSSFADDFDDAITSIKMETDVSEVCLVEADALVAMVDAKLRSPQQVTFGPGGLQRIFSAGGIINTEIVSEKLI